MSDYGSEMSDHDLTDAVVERLLAGAPSVAPAERDVADALAAVRAAYPPQDPPPVGPALADFVAVDLRAVPAGGSRRGAADWYHRKVAAATAFAGTVAGKFALGMTVAFAAAGGAHAAGVIDVPLLPERRAALVDDGGDIQVTSTSAAVTTTPTHFDDVPGPTFPSPLVPNADTADEQASTTTPGTRPPGAVAPLVTAPGTDECDDEDGDAFGTDRGRDDASAEHDPASCEDEDGEGADDDASEPLDDASEPMDDTSEDDDDHAGDDQDDTDEREAGRRTSGDRHDDADSGDWD